MQEIDAFEGNQHIYCDRWIDIWYVHCTYVCRTYSV